MSETQAKKDLVPSIEAASLGKVAASIELETVILGAILIEPIDALLRIEGILGPDDFFEYKHKLIFAAMLEMYAGLHKLDILTLAEYLRSKGQLDEVGGVYAIATLGDNVASTANIEAHARIVKQYAMRRQAALVGRSVVAQALESGNDVFDALDKAENAIAAIRNGAVLNTGAKNMRQLFPDALKRLKEASSKKGEVTGVGSGFKALDAMTSGWQKSDLIVLAGRPGMGKTALALNMAVNAAKAGTPVAFFSLEMSAEQLVMRVISSELEISSENIREGLLTEADWQLVAAKADSISSLPLHVNDTAGISVADVRAECRRLQRKGGLGLVVIDYLQLMTASGIKNREQEISAISRALKGLAKELSVPVIALSQLSREVEKRPTKRPQLSDLRESGAIEQDADIVSFVYRAEYYKILEDDEGHDLRGKAEVILAKHRNGSTGAALLCWNGSFSKFSNEPLASNAEAYDAEPPSDGLPF